MRYLDEEDLKDLMLNDAYKNKYNKDHNKTITIIEQGFQCLYPDDDRNINPKKYYIWRSVNDNQTRSSHTKRDGKIFC